MAKKAPEIRFKGFSDDWEQRTLGEVVDRVTRKNTKLESTLPLTISAQEGLVDQNNFFNKQVASRDVTNYYLLKKGEFAYNKSYSKDYPWGAIKRLDKYEMGVLSTLYIAFKPVTIDSDFLVAYYDTNRWHKEVSMRAAEGARNHGLLNITADDFFETLLKKPIKNNEQNKIGFFFKQIDNSISLHQRKLNTLQQLKKGFLQKLFPAEKEKVPQLRFADFTGEWEQRRLGDMVDFFSGLTYSPDNIVEQPGTLVLRSSNVQDGEIVNADNVYVDNEVVNSDNVQVGDIAVVVRNGSRSLIGKHATIKYPMKDTVIGAFMTGVRSDTPLFINALLDTQEFDLEITKNLGATINQITIDNFKKMIFKFPKVDERLIIGNIFNQLDDTIVLHQRNLDKLQLLKKALLQKMFV